MNTTLCATQDSTSHSNTQLQTIKTPAKKSSAPLSTRKESPATLSHTDSLFLFPQKQSFSDQCLKDININNLINNSSLKKTLTSDTTTTTTTLTTTTQLSQTQELTNIPRGTSVMHQYSTIAISITLLIILLYTLIKFSTNKFFAGLFSFVVSGVSWRKIEHDASLRMSINVLIVHIAYYLFLACFIAECCLVFMPQTYETITLLKYTALILCGIFIVYCTRYVLDGIIGFAFDISEKMRIIRLYKHTSCSLMALILFPLIAIMPFASAKGCELIIGLSIIVAATIIIIRIIKSALLSATSLPSLIYYFLYLALVEILPILCIINFCNLIFVK